MSRTHMVVVSCSIHGHTIESRMLVCINSSKNAAIAALNKLCPGGQIDMSHKEAIGLTSVGRSGVFSVSHIKSIKPSDVLTLSSYFPIHVPSPENLQDAS